MYIIKIQFKPRYSLKKPKKTDPYHIGSVFLYAWHGRNLTGESPEHGLVLPSA